MDFGVYQQILPAFVPPIPCDSFNDLNMNALIISPAPIIFNTITPLDPTCSQIINPPEIASMAIAIDSLPFTCQLPASSKSTEATQTDETIYDDDDSDENGNSSGVLTGFMDGHDELNDDDVHALESEHSDVYSEGFESGESVAEESDGSNRSQNDEVVEKQEANVEDVAKKHGKCSNFQRTRYSREEYRCTMCPYKCTTEKAYLRHLTKHTQSESPVPDKKSCPVCGKDRRTQPALNKHMAKHRTGRHFCCDICKFKTIQLKKLIQHRRMHTGEKPHLCPHCTYRSTRRDNLRSHLRRVHKKDNFDGDTFIPREMLLTPRKKQDV